MYISKKSKTPILEDQLLSGKLEKTNEHAIAKISGIKLSEFILFKKIRCDMFNANKFIWY